MKTKLYLVMAVTALIIATLACGSGPVSVSTPTSTLSPADYSEISPQELDSYADNHNGEHIKVQIKIFNIVQNSNNRELQGNIVDTDIAVYVKTSIPFSSLYSDDVITVYGTVSGSYCFKNAMNAEICQPRLDNAFYTKP